MNLRMRILEAAADLLARAPVADVSTRAVCEAAGVGAPALYRHFGDKDGLLSAVVDHGFEQYLQSKRVARATEDPVRDLRAGWDNHTAFALAHPNLYRLMYAPGLATPPAAAAEAHALLLAVLERCAAAGRLRVAPATAAQMVMSANTGVSLLLLARPAIYDDPAVSARVRDAIVADIVAPGDPAADPAAGGARTVAVAAATLAARLHADRPAALSDPELALLQQWLAALADAPSSDPKDPT